MSGSITKPLVDTQCRKCAAPISTHQQCIVDDTEYGLSMFCSGNCHTVYMRSHPAKTTKKVSTASWS